MNIVNDYYYYAPRKCPPLGNVLLLLVHILPYFPFVRQFDLRQPHTCNTSSKNCRNVLINLNIYVGAMAEAKCLAINPLQPELLAVGCNDPFVRLYDHRMLVSHSFSEVKKSSNSTPEDAKLPPGCVQYFAPGHLPPQLSKDLRRRFRAFVATYINFSPCGRELIANLGGEQIYLFDIKKQREVLKYQTINGTSPSLSSNGVVKSVVDNFSIPSCKNGFSSSANGATNGYKIPTLNGKRTAFEEETCKVGHGSSCSILKELPPRALELKAKGNDAFCQQNFWKAINLYNEAILHAANSAVLYANRAAAYIKRAWYVMSCPVKKLIIVYTLEIFVECYCNAFLERGLNQNLVCSFAV